MHEYGLAEHIIEAAVDAAAGRRITSVRVRIGVRQAADGTLLRDAFELAAEGTPAAEATLEVVLDPVMVACSSCGRATTCNDPLDACVHCGSADVRRSGGTDLVLESVRCSGEPHRGGPAPTGGPAG